MDTHWTPLFYVQVSTTILVNVLSHYFSEEPSQPHVNATFSL